MKMLLRPLLLSLLATVACMAMGADIIIESRSGGQNFTGYKETAGRWLDSNTPAETAKSGAPGLTPQGQLGSRKTTVNPPVGASKDAVISAARFTPTIAAAGDYHVYITFPKAGNASPVTYVIKHAKGEEKKEISQNGWGRTGSANGNIWIDLGTYSFAPGTDQYVEAQVTGATGAADPDNPASAFADAVRFSTDAIETAKPATPPTTAQAPKVAAAPTAAAQPDTGDIQWLDSLAAGRSAGSSQNKKLFVYFYSPQSARSTDYEKQVINDPKVKGVLKDGFVAVKINMDSERELTAQLQVFRAGTINVYDSASGNGLEHISDTPDANELVKRLNAVK